MSKEEDFPTKLQEGNTSDGKLTRDSSSSTPWLRLKDPRIVRVSRAFGGKDRHSKVFTVKGLRDRRVRLSVPTAIQLYDLQEKLRLNQPSKVFDWLLDAAKHEIEELPPLRMPPGNFGLNQKPMLTSYEVSPLSNREGFSVNNGLDLEDTGELPRSNIWSSDALWRAKSKEVARESVNEKEILIKRNKEEEGGGNGHGAQIPFNNFLPRANHTPLPGLLNNAMPYGSYYHWEHTNFPLSHFGSHGFTSQSEDIHNFNVMSMPPTLSLASGSQILVCPPGTTQSYFPSHVTTSVEIDPRQISHLQMLSSSTQNLLSSSLAPPLYSISQSMRPFHFRMTPKLFSQNSSGSQANREDDFPPK